jgi:hypothetical protein
LGSCCDAPIIDERTEEEGRAVGEFALPHLAREVILDVVYLTELLGAR